MFKKSWDHIEDKHGATIDRVLLWVTTRISKVLRFFIKLELLSVYIAYKILKGYWAALTTVLGLTDRRDASAPATSKQTSTR